MNLLDYLMQHLGQPIPKLRVISALGNLGTVEVVTWKKFPENSSLRDEIDEENSWVSIKWDNGNYTDQSIDLLSQVEVKS